MGAGTKFTRNLSIKKGLRNGAPGTAEGITYKEDQYSLALPIAALIHFDRYKVLFFKNAATVPIVLVIST